MKVIFIILRFSGTPSQCLYCADKPQRSSPDNLKGPSVGFREPSWTLFKLPFGVYSLEPCKYPVTAVPR